LIIASIYSQTGEQITSINQLKIIFVNNKSLAILIGLLILSMMGLPPLIGFFGKYFLFFTIFKEGSYFFLAFILLANIISSFYYLNLFLQLFFFNKNYKHFVE
jgi:NADH-quinone oxidoreductase subunit N